MLRKTASSHECRSEVKAAAPRAHTKVPPAPEASARQSATVDGWTINLATLDSTVQAIIGAAKSRDSFSCFTLNLDHLVKLRDDAAFREAYRSARFVTADGAPVAAIARRQWPQVQRTTGADLLIPLCEAAAREGLPIYLFGTSQDVLRDTADFLQRHTGGLLKIAGTDSPPQGFDPAGAQGDAAIERIGRSGARLCFVLLGAPKQEILAERAVDAGVGCGFIGVGAAADFIAGHQQRAPAMMRRAGLEWLWRLVRQPRRLALRYLRCGLLLARIEADYWLRWGRTP